MPAFYTDEQGRVRVIPDGKPLHADIKKQQGSRASRPEPLPHSARAPQPRLSLPKFGENATGPLSNAPPKPLPYHNEIDLTQKLYGHFVTGQGQPVEIDLGKLDFSRHVDARRLLKDPILRQRMLLPIVPSGNTDPATARQNEQALLQALGKDGKILGHNEKLTVIEFTEPFEDSFNIPPTDPAKFASFGKIPFKLIDIELYINHQNRTVTITGDITQSSQLKGRLDRFDFDPGKRPWYAEALVQAVHYGTLPGSTSFDIYPRKGSSSRYQQTYSFAEFLK